MGEIDLDPDAGELDSGIPTALVFRWDPTVPSYVFLPNIYVLDVKQHENDNPGSARFMYNFLDAETQPTQTPWPDRIEDVWFVKPKNKPSNVFVSANDRLVVRLYYGDDEEDYDDVFDGFAFAPQANLGDQESATFEAFGAPVRLSDIVISQTFVRGFLIRYNGRPCDPGPVASSAVQPGRQT